MDACSTFSDEVGSVAACEEVEGVKGACTEVVEGVEEEYVCEEPCDIDMEVVTGFD